MFNIFDSNASLNDFNFILSQRGEDIQINNKSENIKALITNTNLEQVYDDRKITTLHDIVRGDIIKYNNKTYMVISEVTSKRYVKFKAVMRHLPYKITLNQNCSFVELDCYITNSNLKVDAGTVMSLASGNIQVHISKQQITTIPLTSRFFVGNQIFKVEGIDDFTREGIITLSCKSDLIDPVKDDVTNRIADIGTCKINIINESVQLEEGDTHQISYTTANNDVIVFTSSDTGIVTVNDTGLVTAIAEGQATVTLYNATMPNLMAEMLVQVNAVVVDEDITIEITSDYAPNEITSGQSKVYRAIVKRGNEVLNEPVTWQLFADNMTSTTNAATITSQDGVNSTVKNNNNTKDYVQLKATLVSDASVYSWLRIRMKGFL